MHGHDDQYYLVINSFSLINLMCTTDQCMHATMYRSNYFEK